MAFATYAELQADNVRLKQRLGALEAEVSMLLRDNATERAEVLRQDIVIRDMYRELSYARDLIKWRKSLYWWHRAWLNLTRPVEV